MNDTIMGWLFDPTIGKIVAVVVGIVVLIVMVRFAQRLVGNYVKEASSRYRARKFVTIIGYLLGIVLLATVYSSKLGGLTVAFGVAGAGITFALQEVIASVAGWLAITLSNFFKTGDRVQLGGIKGDVIDIGVLRTTVMECGEWVKGDLYTGRVVRIANSFVFKEPVYNYSGDFPFLWDEIIIPVMSGSD
ncbi:MAG: mechanosensitive ion channel domain-containing protein, partial [Bacteroidota bacterium]